MKKLLLSLPLLALATLASADAMSDATVMANGVPATAMMDGRRVPPGTVVAADSPGNRVVRTGSGADLTLSRRTTGMPPAPAPEEPGFFSKAWDFVKKPSFLAPAVSAVAFGAMGAMIAGPLGAITGLAIGGLLGFLFVKAMG